VTIQRNKSFLYVVCLLPKDLDADLDELYKYRMNDVNHIGRSLQAFALVLIVFIYHDWTIAYLLFVIGDSVYFYLVPLYDNLISFPIGYIIWFAAHLKISCMNRRVW